MLTTTTLDHAGTGTGDAKPSGIVDAGGYSTTRRNMLDIANSLYGTGWVLRANADGLPAH